MIAVTGVTGTLGGRVLERLAASGRRPPPAGRAGRRRAPRPSRARRWSRTPAGTPTPTGFRAALDGVDTLYLVSAAEAEDRLQQHVDAVDAAVAAGVQRIVYTSFLGAKDDAVFTLVRQHAATEDRIRAERRPRARSSGTACTRTSCRSSPPARTGGR